MYSIAKTDLGRVSKQILSKIVADIRSSSNYNHWNNTTSVIEWFKRIENKKKSRFIQFDIVEFYPSITEELLDKAIQFAKQASSIAISDNDIAIIKQCKASLLFSNSECWVKKSGNIFDVTMGSYDGAETCELVGLYLP